VRSRRRNGQGLIPRCRCHSGSLPAQATEFTGQAVTWYLGGTLPGWQGVSLAVVVLLEEFDPVSAQQIGQAVLQSAIGPYIM